MASCRPCCCRGLSIVLLLTFLVAARAQSQCSSTSTLLSAQTYFKTLKFPAYGGFYGNNLSCKWKISGSSSSSTINITVVSLNLQHSYSCVKDSLSIYDGASEYFTRLGKLCGTSSFLPFRSSGRYMFLQFRSDANVTGYGFELRYSVDALSTTTTRPVTPSVNGSSSNTTVNRTTAYPPTYSSSTVQPVNSTCSGLLQAVHIGGSNYTVSLYSPDYPSNYPSNARCLWSVIATGWNHVVRLHVVDIDMENTSRCAYDALSLYNANYADSDYLLRRLCGRQAQGEYVYSSGQHMFLYFKSDSSIEKRGFHVEVTAVPAWAVPSTTTTSLPGPCSGTQYLTATNSYKFLFSPNFPRNYSNNLDCSWRISSIGWNPIVRVRILEFDLESRLSCDFDSLAFYDGSGPTSRLLNKLCGRQVEERYIYSTGFYMYLRFQTNAYNTRKGFRLEYISTNTVPTTIAPSTGSCSIYRLLTTTLDHESVLFSPNYPNGYGNNLDCGWRIQTNMWRGVIRLRVVDLDLEQHDDCDYDSLSVYDGSGSTSPRLRKFCGQWANVSYIYSRSMYMYIRFKTDTSTSGRGFKLQYKAVSSSDVPQKPTTPALIEYETFTLTAPILASTGYLESDGYPSYFHSYTKKMWKIRAWSGYIVNIRVIDMDIQQDPQCADNQVTVYDSDYSSVLATMCNFQFVGVDLYSSHRELYVYFTTTYLTVGKGFKLNYQSVSSLEASSTYTTRSPWDHPDFLDTRKDETDNTAAIVGGVIGGLFILVLIVTLGLFFYCRSKRMSPSSPGQTLAFRNPSTTYNNNSNNTSSSPGVYVMPSAPVSQSHGNMGYAVIGNAPPSYFGVQNTFPPGAQAVAGAAPPAVAPPKYAEAMLMSHPPSAGAVVGIPAQVGSYQMTPSASAPPPEPDPLSPEVQPAANPALVPGEEHAAGLESDYFTGVQSSGEEPHVYATLENTNPETSASNI